MQNASRRDPSQKARTGCCLSQVLSLPASASAVLCRLHSDAIFTQGSRAVYRWIRREDAYIAACVYRNPGALSNAHTHTTCLLSLTHVPIRCAVVVFCSPCTRLKKITPGGRTPDNAGGAAWRPDVGEGFERSGGPERAAVSREVRSNGTHKERREGGRKSWMFLSLVLATMYMCSLLGIGMAGGGEQREMCRYGQPRHHAYSQ